MFLLGIFIIAAYILISFFVGIRILKSLCKFRSPNIKVYWTVFSFIALSFVLGELTGRFIPSGFSKILSLIGYYYMAALLYMIILFPVASLLHRIFKNTNFDFYGISLLFIAILLIIGTYFGFSPYVKYYDITTEKPLKNGKLKIALVSDVHLGEIIGNSRLKTMIDKINALDADAVIIAGDLIDSNLEPMLQDDMLSQLKYLKSKYGTFFAFGNHDFYTGRSDEIAEILRENGVHVLRDEAALINDEFYIIGEDDKAILKYGGNNKPLNCITDTLNKDKLSILINHVPNDIDESSTNGIDLQVSGHTHRGQLFPCNLVTRSIFDIDYGLKKFDNTNVVVSSGYGTWGPPLRIGSRSEIVMICLTN